MGPNKVYFLEQHAYNNKDFRIPDNNGTQCHKEKICPELELDQPLSTLIDLEKVAKQLADKCKETVEVSSDPGRYLCNYIYYCSLKMNK